MTSNLNKTLIALILTVSVMTSCANGCCDDNTIQVSGNAKVNVEPDQATLTVRVLEQARTSSEALAASNRKINSAITVLNQNGLTEEHYSTSSISLNPKYEYQFGQRQVVAQTAEQTLTVVIENLAANGETIGNIIDDIAALEVNVDGLRFEQTDKELGMKAARKAAFESAKQKAQEYADLSGRRLLRVLTIQESSPVQYNPYIAEVVAFRAVADSSTTIPIGDVSVEATVQTTWALV